MRSRRSNVLSGTRDDDPEYYKAEKLNKHQCKQCGSCCIIHWRSFEATEEDMIRWRREGRADILKHLPIASNDLVTFVSDSCPFLKRNEKENIYYCVINDTKPFYCRNYPDDGICEREADRDNQRVLKNHNYQSSGVSVEDKLD